MSRRHTVERQQRSLAEIREIMNSMKTLAYLETRKLSRFLEAQQDAVSTIDDAAADFISFYPDTLPATAGEDIVLVVGSERGFCGDFNQRLLHHTQGEPHGDADEPYGSSRLIVIGHKLHGLFDADPRVCSMLSGASVAEEVTAVLSAIASVLTELQDEMPDMTLRAIAHDDDGGIVSHHLLPAFTRSADSGRGQGFAPQLNLEPARFLLELGEHYLFAALHGLLYTSLMAESHERLNHLEGAIRHLDEQSETLGHRVNELRQEEIIEEIETILLNARTGGLRDRPGQDRSR